MYLDTLYKRQQPSSNCNIAITTNPEVVVNSDTTEFFTNEESQNTPINPF